MRALSLDDAKAWLRALNGDPDRARQIVIGLGVIGDPAVVPWLIERMHDPALARVAGESLSMITGVDLVLRDLDGDMPEGFAAGQEPADAPVTADPDERLPWPAPDKVEAWWTSERDHFAAGHRYLLGALVRLEEGRRAWANGYQRQRRAAAFELARLRPTDGLANWRQRNLLA